MASRKRAHQKTPDVLGEVLSKPETPKAEISGIPENQEDSIPVRQKDVELASRSDAEKVKATFYLSQEAVDALDEAWYRLRRLTKTHKGRVSKSAIVDIAVQMTLEDLEAEGPESHLARKMIRQ